MDTAMTQKTRRIKDQQGFTLVEVMIAIVVLMIGILTVVAAFATAVGANQNAQENLIARQKALEAMGGMMQRLKLTVNPTRPVSAGIVFSSSS